MDWFYKHLGAIVGGTTIVSLGLLAVLFRKSLAAGWFAIRIYQAKQNTIHQTDQRLVDGYQDLTTLTEKLTAAKLTEANAACEVLKREKRELEMALIVQVRATMTRDGINRQDRAMIRALENRLRENKIDFSDIAKAIQQQFANE